MDAAIPIGQVPAAAGCGGYPDSVGSSPRSRSGSDAWDDLFPASAAPAKLRLMCSYSGQIVPRPHDKTLCYVNGETRMVTVDRHATLAELSAKLSRSLLGGRSFTLKYQLPNEDLDSLISVTTNEDLENMIDEYDRISSSQSGSGGKASRLRLFLFPAKSELNSANSMSSLLDDSKSETWFVDALNGAIGMGGVISPKHQDLPGGGGSTASSVNCLVSLDEDQNYPPPPVPEVTSPVDQNHQIQAQHPHPDSSGKRIPDSIPVLDTSSSFGSTSSAQSSIRARPDDVGANVRPTNGGLEDHFSHMKVSSQKQEEILKDEAFAAKSHQPQTPVSPPIDPAHSLVSCAASAISPSESPNFGARSISHDEVKVDIAEPPIPQLLQQPKPGAADPPPPIDMPLIYYAEPPSAAIVDSLSDPRHEGLFSATNSNYAPQMTQGKNYMQQMLPVQQDQFQLIPQLQQQQQPQQQQQLQAPQQLQQQHYVHANQPLIHHNSGPMQMHPYYQMPQPIPSQPHMIQGHPYNQQVPMYYMPARSNLPAYAPQAQQPTIGDVVPIPSTSRPAVSIPNPVLAHATSAPLTAAHPEFTPPTVYRTTSIPPSSAPQLINYGDQAHHQYMAYQQVHHHPSQTTAAPNYGYEYPNPMKPQPVYYTQAPPASQFHPQPASQFNPHYASSNSDI